MKPKNKKIFFELYPFFLRSLHSLKLIISFKSYFVLFSFSFFAIFSLLFPLLFLVLLFLSFSVLFRAFSSLHRCHFFFKLFNSLVLENHGRTTFVFVWEIRKLTSYVTKNIYKLFLVYDIYNLDQ